MLPGKWWRPTLAFLITFGLLAMVGSMTRVIVLYQHAFAIGLQPDHPDAVPQLAEEVGKIDRAYTPRFLIVATVVALISAWIFARWRPKSRIQEPPPFPEDRGQGENGGGETR